MHKKQQQLLKKQILEFQTQIEQKEEEMQTVVGEYEKKKQKQDKELQKLKDQNLRDSSQFGLLNINQEDIKAGMEAGNIDIRDLRVDYR